MMSGKEGVEERSEAEEVKEVLSAISGFLKEITPIVKELIGIVLGSFRGDALGKEVGEFYRSLVEAGISEDKAVELAEEFLKRKMKLLNLADVLSRLIPRREVEVEERKERKEE
ncbi:MAG: hypothetical protein DRJ96_03220 [Thermoprotei archaeon]|nr:MAG: hypothetical protein DRJ67_01185 [Thermoprotei archaeon]RLE97681.1 MAG: hypothetical protein DRJ96_03220 [Thermoprotei archaeon]